MAYKNFKATEIIEEIGIELRRIRTERKQTISYVATELSGTGLHISATLLGRVENGERRIDDDTLNAICTFYGVDSSEIIIAASKEHIRRISEKRMDRTDVPEEVESEQLMHLYRNLNMEGQREVTNLMRLMAYMDAFRKLS